MSSRSLCDVIRLMTGPLAAIFRGGSWDMWRAVLRAAHALELTPDERQTVATVTNRSTLPSWPVRELWLLLGRRSGKSIVAALHAVWATCCRTYKLAPGEVGIFIIIAADRRQGRIIKRYVAGLLRAHPSLEILIERETTEAIWLTNGLCIEIHTCSWKTVRGYTCIGAAVDEIAFWDSEDSANPDHEVLIALRAAMASVPEAMLVALTSVYARRGEAWRVFERHFGRDDSPDVLVVNGPTLAFNPTIDPRVIDAARADDPMAAESEYDAEFRRDLEAFVSREVVESCVVARRYELPALATLSYAAFVDPSGGTADSFSLAIAHRERDDRDIPGRLVLDCVRETRPPFSPQTVVLDYAAVLKNYRVNQVTGDRYAGEWPREQFRKCGIEYVPAGRPKSDLYRDLLPLLNSSRFELLDHPRLTGQLLHLERRVSRGGQDRIDHAPRMADDVANVVAGVASVLMSKRPVDPDLVRWCFAAGARDRNPFAPLPMASSNVFSPLWEDDDE
jgi:hypothetical protein